MGGADDGERSEERRHLASLCVHVGTLIVAYSHDLMAPDWRVVRHLSVSRRDGDPTLVVITCGGGFDRGRGYTDNVIVTAQPVG